jgi:uncharacterized membrane protein
MPTLASRASSLPQPWLPGHGLRAMGLYAVGICFVASVALVWLRVWLSGTASLAFLHWNLTLAFLPYAASLVALRARGRRPWLLAPLGLFTLLFLPNAFYLVTDLIHLRQRPLVPLWFDVGLIGLSAGTGWFLGLLTLRMWRELVAERFGPAAGWAIALVSAPLCGYGIYLGRFLRWNSWDLLRAPWRLLGQVAGHLRPPWDPQLLGVSLFFGALVLVTFLAFELARTPSAQSR